MRVANSYDEAMTEIARPRPNVLLSDVGMPGKDGYALINEIQQHEAGVRLRAIAIKS